MAYTFAKRVVTLDFRGISFGYLPEAVALFAAMTVQPDAARKDLINTTIGALITTGVWSRCALLYVMAAHHEQAARLNWKTPGTATLTATGGPVFTTDRGYAGDQSDAVLDTGVNANALSGYAQNDAHTSAWVRTISSANNFEYVGFGMSANQLNPQDGFNRALGNINFGGVIDMAGGVGVGFFNLVRTASNAWQFYKNGSLVNSFTDVSGALPATSFKFLTNGSNFTGSQLLAGSMGASLTAQNATDLYTALNAYKTAVGA
jgi:hypothetical protein